MKCIKVNENCIGCGSCVSIANDIFDFNDEGYACVKEDINLNDEEILFTYDVVFQYSNITFASRWDIYKNINKNIHWAGIITSNIIIFILSFIVCCVFFRNIRRDIDLYNQRVTGEEFLDEFGWKQVCNDVFRPVYYNKMLLRVALFIIISIGKM